MPKSPAPDIGSFLYLENHISLSLTEKPGEASAKTHRKDDGERAKGMGERTKLSVNYYLSERRVYYE